MGCTDEDSLQLAELLGHSFDGNISAQLSIFLCNKNLASSSLESNESNSLAAVQASLAETIAKLEELTSAVDTVFLLFSAYLVFIMQCGFALLCAGSVRSKNTMNILLKNVIDACVGAGVYYLVGFGVAYGNHPDFSNGFIGTDHFALAKYEDYAMFMFQFAFAATATTIVSGSVAERCAFLGYILYAVLLTSFVQPTVAHWVWDAQGWLSPFHKDPMLGAGFVDFAGCGPVHMVGGLSGLMGAWIVGPRMGRFTATGAVMSMPGHSAPLVVAGTFLLWFGWYGFNPGSMFIIASPAAGAVVARSAVTTTLGGAAGGFTLLMHKFRASGGHLDLAEACNGVLCGLVAVTAGCSVMEPWAAILVGAGAAFVFDAAGRMLLRMKVDDPLGAAPMHGACGIWGIFFAAFFAKKEYMEQVYDRVDTDHFGVFYGGGGAILACQLLGILAIALWTCAILGVYFYVINYFGYLRANHLDEQKGMDMAHHGGQAYDFRPDSVSSKPVDSVHMICGKISSIVPSDSNDVLNNATNIMN
mmetsp:Transcript_24853/g.34246  ORF Transcript_24853/g.34246 Transcript_24853/m.34246 type:complete len:530 (+) Transcript_24853:262-1851(+)|eukprot:CAMPEP_0196594460 /NCGR_PEP_ID=MMETSP1081-20130531/78465_1 /TAXON_ID=36882 /ORGANISM="Pyramimonas amylifera, Strain CCMP720" /LENGTH=529 /DNA_ID=CAMNT_0041918741 /DNA_START=250 /DNA_END=1839 /DNA_ORIENTATION=+